MDLQECVRSCEIHFFYSCHTKPLGGRFVFYTNTINTQYL